MPKRVNGMPECPKCGQAKSRVILTKDTLDGQFDIIRRRCCLHCGHRWYTGQMKEIAIHSVAYADRGDLIYRCQPIL